MLAFLAGAIAGAAVALLFAPAPGEETRQILGEKAREGRERAASAARQGREFLNRQRDTVKSALDRGREAYQTPRAPTPRTSRDRLDAGVPRDHRAVRPRDGGDPGGRDRVRRPPGSSGQRAHRPVEREMAPVFAHLQTLSAEAARASTLAAQQVERADRLFADVSGRLEDTVAAMQSAVITPAREGLALVAGIKAALAALRDLTPQAAADARPARAAATTTIPCSSAERRRGALTLPSGRGRTSSILQVAGEVYDAVPSCCGADASPHSSVVPRQPSRRGAAPARSRRSSSRCSTRRRRTAPLPA